MGNRKMGSGWTVKNRSQDDDRRAVAKLSKSICDKNPKKSSLKRGLRQLW